MHHFAPTRWHVPVVFMIMALAAESLIGQDASQTQKSKLDGLWADFNHYVRIARPDIAQASAMALLEKTKSDNDALLVVVERGDYPDWQRTIIRASKTETLREVAQQLGQRIQQAKITHSREPERIKADIHKLAEGARPRANATARLRAAGQFAAPHLLATLQDDGQKRLHPSVMAAMVAIGRPMVYPLSVAVPECEPVTMGQLSQVLAEIRYPKVLPYLKQILEREGVDPAARIVVQSAYDQLVLSSPLPANVTAAELFLTLAQNLYRAQTEGQILPGYDEATDSGIVWEYSRNAGLVAVPVPGSVYGDVLAMRATRTALELNPNLDPALSLWLMANLRRANNLPPDRQDLSYQHVNPPAYYLNAAGPLRQHDVLDQALLDGDSALALDAIQALEETAGPDALVHREGTAQPLLAALSYPDRRVRYSAAFAMTNARPKAEFPGSHRVVPVLSEAIRQSDRKFALILAQDQNTLNSLMASLKQQGYRPAGALNMEGLADQVAHGPGVDLILISHVAGQVAELYRHAQGDYKLAVVPIVAIVSAGDQIELKRQFGDEKQMITVDSAKQDEQLISAMEKVNETFGTPIGPVEGEQLALTALRLLREVAVGKYDVFKVSDAKAAVVTALNDPRQPIVIQAAGVLALMDDAQVQQTLANAALGEARPDEIRVALLGSLAESATYYGNHLTAGQIEKLLTLVKTSRDALAVEAGRTYGALTLPTRNVVDLITQ